MQIIEPRETVGQSRVAGSSDVILSKIFAVFAAKYIIIFVAAADEARRVTTDEILHRNPR